MTNRWFLDICRPAPCVRHASLLGAALLCGLFVLAQPARAQTIITTDTTINYAINDDVFVKASPTGSPTVALVSGGSIERSLSAYDTSTINYSGASIGMFLNAYNSTTINYSGGYVRGYTAAHNTSTVNFTGGSTGGSLLALDSSTVNVSGGTIGIYLYAFNSGTVNMSGGTVSYGVRTNGTGTANVSGGSMGYVDTSGTSTANVSGGSIGSVRVNDTSTVNLSGGTIGTELLVFGTGAVVNVYGTGLRLAGPFTDQDGFTYYALKGTLQDGTPVNDSVYLIDDNGTQLSQIHLFNTDPFVALKAKVQALGDAGVLNKGNTNALLVKLNAAQTAQAAGDTAGESDALTAFVNQVNAFIRTGKLTSAQGTALTTAAQAILNGLG